MQENPFIDFPPLSGALPGPSVIIPETGAGSRWQPQAEAGLADQPTEPGGNASVYGAFFGMYTIADGVNAGDVMLQGGQVSAGSGTETVSDYRLFDASDGPEGSWAGGEGDHLTIRLNGTGSESDDVLMPTFDMTSLSGPTVLAPVPDDVLPTLLDLTGGQCVVSLGVFAAAGFSPALAGNIQVGFCFGGFTRSRF